MWCDVTVCILCTLCTMQRAKQMVTELISARESGSGVSTFIIRLEFVFAVNCECYVLSLCLVRCSHLDLEHLLKQAKSLCVKQTSVEYSLGKVRVLTAMHAGSA